MDVSLVLYRKWIEMKEIKRKGGNVESESLSISSISLHFLILSPFPLHFLILSIFLQPGCQAATICATLIGWNILKRTMVSKSVKKNGIYESDKDGRESRPSVGWLVLPFGREQSFFHPSTLVP